tara:strand:- start:787 stop:1392 length:606 start_codon:yes stop_codon:yes gene_type:complete
MTIGIAQDGRASLGSLYGNENIGGDYINNLPAATDPDKIYEQMTRQEYLDYVENYRGFEEQLIEKAQTDTSLIDAARTDSQAAAGLMSGVSDRNASRYGVNLTPAQRQERGRSLNRANTLGGVQSITDARVNQREANQAQLADLINIGQGVNRSSQSQMGSAAANATQRKNAYDTAKANSKAQTYSTLGGLGAMAIMAFAF